MKYTEARVGKRVLYNFNRQSNPRYRLAQSFEAEILEIGLFHEFQVNVSNGAFKSRLEKRTSNRGIKIRITRDLIQRQPVGHGETELLPETYEKIVEPAFLRLAFGEVYDSFKQKRANLLDASVRMETARAERAGVVASFAAFGIEIRIDGPAYTLNDDSAREVLRRFQEIAKTLDEADKRHHGMMESSWVRGTLEGKE